MTWAKRGRLKIFPIERAATIHPANSTLLVDDNGILNGLETTGYSAHGEFYRACFPFLLQRFHCLWSKHRKVVVAKYSLLIRGPIVRIALACLQSPTDTTNSRLFCDTAGW